MKSLSLLLSILLLTACYPANYNAYIKMSHAFQAGCELKTIVTSVYTDGDTLIIKSVCTKEK